MPEQQSTRKWRCPACGASGETDNPHASLCAECGGHERLIFEGEPPAPTPLFGGADMRCEALREAVKATIYERALGLPMPLILGVLRIVEHELLTEQG